MGAMRRTLHRIDDAIYAAERVLVVAAMAVMVLLVFFDVMDRRLQAQESKLAGLLQTFHVPAPETVAPFFGGALLTFLIWFGLATVRRRRGKALVPPTLEFVLALAGAAALFGLGWVMLHRPSKEFFVVVWSLSCFGAIAGTLAAGQRGAAAAWALGLVAGDAALYAIVPEGYSWAKEVAMILLVWTGLLGASMAAHQGSHIEIDFGRKLLPKRARKHAAVLAMLITAGFCGLIVLLGVIYVFGENGLYRLQGRFPHTGVPDWTVAVAIPWCFGMIGLRVLITASRVLGGAVDARGSSPSAVRLDEAGRPIAPEGEAKEAAQ